MIESHNSLTPKEQARLAYDQQTAGLEYGATIADYLIDAFPDRFSGEVPASIGTLVDEALAAVTSNFHLAGVSDDIIEPYEVGYRIAVRSRFAEYASDCAARTKVTA